MFLLSLLSDFPGQENSRSHVPYIMSDMIEPGKLDNHGHVYEPGQKNPGARGSKHPNHEPSQENSGEERYEVPN